MTTELALVIGRILGHPGGGAQLVADGHAAQVGTDTGLARRGEGIDTHGGSMVPGLSDRRGRRPVGGDADLAVLGQDLLAEGWSAIIGTTSVATLVGGRVHRTEGPA